MHHHKHCGIYVYNKSGGCRGGVKCYNERFSCIHFIVVASIVDRNLLYWWEGAFLWLTCRFLFPFCMHIMCVTNGGNIIDVCMIWQKILAFFPCMDRHMCMSVCEYIYIFMLACMNRWNVCFWLLYAFIHPSSIHSHEYECLLSKRIQVRKTKQ